MPRKGLTGKAEGRRRYRPTEKKEDNTMKKYGVMARNRGMWGELAGWCVGLDGKPLLFDTYEDAATEAEKYRKEAGQINNFTHYFPKEYSE